MASALDGRGADAATAAAATDTSPRDGGAAQYVPAIALSRRRCAERGLPRELARLLPSADVPPPEAEAALARVLAFARPAMEDVYQFIEGSRTVIGFADTEARILDLVGDRALTDELSAAGLRVGASVSEACAGTNGVALTLDAAFPTLVSGDAHYCALLTPYCTAAAPVHDSLGGLVGALFAFAPAIEGPAHLLGMVSAVATALSGELRMNLWLGSANELLSELNAILQTLSEGILLLQPDGMVSQMNARAGHLLGLTPARATGRRLADLVEIPPALGDALRLGRELHDEEVTFIARGNRVTCLCTLRGIAASAALGTMASFHDLSDPDPRKGLPQRGAPGLSVSPAGTSGGYVLTLRSIERVQRLVHRMSGAQARMRFGNIVGQSPTLLEAVRLARIAAEGTSTVLLHGETGTGKEIFAQSIHNGSARADGPFVAINCAAIPRELISSELFGYEGGAFTGADRMGRPGKFELANGGTLFLDEIGDMPRDLQTSLLRAIETRSVVRVGGQHVTPVDVRIIAATHRDLAEDVRLGSFRSDLFFRLNVFPIEVPALRERPGDVPNLLRYVLQRLSTRLNRPLGVETDALAALDAYAWPGNVRELENVIERAVYVSDRAAITLADLPDAIRAAWRGRELQSTQPGAHAQYGALGATPAAALAARQGLVPAHHDLRHESEAAELQLIQQVLRSAGGNMTQAAAQLGVSRTTLWRKLRHLPHH
jgi:transcriptional regulator with PAS, ATPase and Fis domain